MTTTASSPELPPSLTALWRSLRMGFRAEPLLLLAGAATTLAAAVPDALFALGFKLFSEAVIRTDRAAILQAALLLAGLAAGGWLLTTASERTNLRLAERAAVHIESYVARLQSTVTTIEHHERTDHLDLLEVLRDHAGTLSQLYRSLFATSGAVLRLVLTVGLLMSVHPALAVLLLFAAPTVLVAMFRAAVEKRIEEDGAQHRRRARHWFVMGSGAAPGKEVRIAGLQERLRIDRRKSWDRSYHALNRAQWITTAWQCTVWCVFGIALAAAVSWVAYQPGAPAERAGAVALVLAAAGRLSLFIGQTTSETHFLRGIWLDASRRLTWLENFAAAHRTDADRPVPERLTTGITYENVSFHYPTSDRMILEDVNLTLPAGKVVAIVGENGAGKTTLIKLLCRFYDPTGGRILVDGEQLDRLPPDDWRARMSGTFQDFQRFEFSAAHTIGLGDLPRIDDRAAVDAAVERAGAGEVLSKLPAGLDTQLGVTWPDGVEISFGQWQRLALSRGFMRDDPLVLVLDEPAAALDAETEHQLFERFAAAARQPYGGQDGRITLLVSHRFSTVRMADLIVVLDGSRVVEVGSHAELIAAGGKYAELYGIQEAAYR
ncbi:MAG TPA: ABC transporter ATP-binding protein [Actinoplanes sp.]|jgi:ATP-binding cassette subfamily B protein